MPSKPSDLFPYCICGDREKMQALERLLKVGFEYFGDKLNAVAFPIGGIGTGTLSISGYGELVEWQIFNNVDSGAKIPHSFFAIRVEIGGEIFTKLLQKRRLTFKKDIWWKRNTILTLSCISEIEFYNLYPIAILKFIDPQLPIDLYLECFNPMIPLDTENSSIPAAVFLFIIKNTSNRKIKVSLLATLQNAIGYDGHSEVEGVRFKDYGENVNEIIKGQDFVAVFMYSKGLDTKDSRYGTMCFACLSPEVTYNTSWTNVVELWRQFTNEGRLANVEKSSPSKKGRTWNAALVKEIELKPNEWKEVIFVITWHFPNRIIDWDPKRAGFRIGNFYNKRFKNALEVLKYLARNFKELRELTETFTLSLYDTTLPRELIESVGSQMSTIRTPTCMWLEDGTVACFEGCGRRAGCCPMNCTHVYNYAQTMAYLYPKLERAIREVDLTIQMEDNGMIHHRTVIPLSEERSSGPATDGHLGTILKFYRELLYYGDIEFLKRHWNRLKLAMAYIFKMWDRDEDGVIEGPQPNTYDCIIHGPNTFIGSLYLASLKAMAKMANIMGDREAEKLYSSLFRSGYKKLDKLTWNGEYFIQRRSLELEAKDKDRASKDKWLSRWIWCAIDNGCLADQLLGQWWAFILNLGYVLPKEHVRRALESIFKYNFRKSLEGHIHDQRVYAFPHEGGLLNCTWPKGGRPSNPILYCDEVWTGVEYEVAALMIYEGMINEALTMLSSVRERYNGVDGNPLNEVECGEHYARPMSSWSLLLAAEGYFYNALEGVLELKPKIFSKDGSFKGFVVIGTGWGTFHETHGEDFKEYRLEVKRGYIELAELILNPPIGKIASTEVRVDGKQVKCDCRSSNEALIIRFLKRIKAEKEIYVKVTCLSTHKTT